MSVPSLLRAALALAILPAAALPAATISFGVASGDWNLNTNWGGGVIPGAGDTAVVTNGREAIVGSVVTPVPDIIRIGNNANGGTLNVTGGSLTGGTFQAATATGAVGHLVVAGGSLTLTASTFLAATNPASVSGTTTTLSISGGALNWGTGLTLGQTGTTTATVTGSAATIAGGSLNAHAGTAFVFVLDQDGVSPYTGSGAMSISGGASLVVDGAAFAGASGSVPLFQFASVSGSFGENVSLVNFGSLEPVLSVAGGAIAVVFSEPPTAPPPVLVPELVGDTLRITCPSASGYAYQLQESADLAQWEDTGAPRNGTGTDLLFEAGGPAAPDGKAFYRVVMSEGGGGIVEGPPWDLDALFLLEPATEDTEEYAITGLRSLFYGSLDWMGSPTRVYAYLGYPEGTPPAAGWPAVVLVHGGGGTAFHQWVQRWNARGFAAIAMDLEGRLPDLTVPFAERPTFEGSGPVRVGVWGDADLPPADQWFYHAVAQTILAHNVLLQESAIDPDKIGIMGVSWGGIITCVVAGIDARFRFAIPVYGCGFLPGSDAQMGKTLATYTEARMERILAWWEPSRYLPSVSMPALFVNSPNDTHFPINAWQQSIDAVPVPTWQSAQIGLTHGHVPPQLLEEPYAFAHAIVAGQPGSLPRLLPPQGVSGTITGEVLLPPEPLAEVRLASTTASGTYIDRPWSRSSATLDAATLSADLPPGATGWFFEAVTHDTLLFTSPYREP